MKVKRFKVEICTDVYIDSFEDGELDRVNWYSNETEVQAVRPLEAIEKALYKIGFSFDKKNADIEDDNICYYSNLIDNDNFEITESDSYYKEWIEGKKTLYAANHSIKVFELSNVNIY